MDESLAKIKKEVSENDVVLYMKGTSSMPQCGFSSRVAGVLNYLEIEFRDINVLEDDSLREEIKQFSDWPTIPQLYVKGEFVGGCDIVTEMTMTGELDKLFAEKANYSNTENYLSIYENVRIDDIRGNLIADKLLFDINKQNLAITSFNDGKINANVKLD